MLVGVGGGGGVNVFAGGAVVAGSGGGTLGVLSLKPAKCVRAVDWAMN